MTVVYQSFGPPPDPIKFSPPPILPEYGIPKIDPIKLGPPPDLFKFDLPKIELLPIDPIIKLDIRRWDRYTILLARPVHELIAHLRDFKIPSFVLIARVIKTLVLAIFRWHLCDHVLLERENDLFLNKKIIHHLSENVLEVEEPDFKSAYPYMLENAYHLKPKKDTEESHDFNYDDVSPDTLRDYFAKSYGIEITPKETGNTIGDLFKSAHLDLVK